MNSPLKFKYVFLLGDWWVHRPSQRERLWDHGEFWKARVEFGSNCCSDSSCKGKFLLALIVLELDIEQCDCTEDLPLLYKKINSASVLKTSDTIKSLQPSPPHTVFVGLFKMFCSYFLDDGDQFTLIQKVPFSFLCRLLIKMTIVSFLSLLCFLVDKPTFKRISGFSTVFLQSTWGNATYELRHERLLPWIKIILTQLTCLPLVVWIIKLIY